MSGPLYGFNRAFLLNEAKHKALGGTQRVFTFAKLSLRMRIYAGSCVMHKGTVNSTAFILEQRSVIWKVLWPKRFTMQSTSEVPCLARIIIYFLQNCFDATKLHPQCMVGYLFHDLHCRLKCRKIKGYFAIPFTEWKERILKPTSQLFFRHQSEQRFKWAALLFNPDNTKFQFHAHIY